MLWAHLGWHIYNLFLLVFALAQGINGLRQVVLADVSKKNIRLVNRVASLYWLVMERLGIAAFLGGARQPRVINQNLGENDGR